jgi:actin-related protein 6
MARDYVLPDFTALRRGFLKSAEETGISGDGEQTIRLNNERFMVPELLFHPSDVGIQQVGSEGFLIPAQTQWPFVFCLEPNINTG